MGLLETFFFLALIVGQCVLDLLLELMVLVIIVKIVIIVIQCVIGGLFL